MSSIISDLDKAPTGLKTILICVALKMPFWYIALYLFKSDWLLNSPIHLPIVFAYCLSLCSFFILFMMVILVKTWPGNPRADKAAIDANKTEEQREKEHKDELRSLGGTSSLLFMVAICIAIPIGLHENFGIQQFLKMFFGSLCVIGLLIFLVGWYLLIRKNINKYKAANRK